MNIRHALKLPSRAALKTLRLATAKCPGSIWPHPPVGPAEAGTPPRKPASDAVAVPEPVYGPPKTKRPSPSRNGTIARTPHFSAPGVPMPPHDTRQLARLAKKRMGTMEAVSDCV